MRHPDDLFSPSSTIDSLAGSGNRSGDIKVSSSANIVLVDGMIGHVNNASETSTAGASAAGGSTQIAVSTADPTDPAGGSLLADSSSEFGGADEVRIYVPERSSNDVEVGALINGVSFAGAAVDPTTAQRDDEFTINVTGVQNVALNQHSNAFDSGPAPVNAGSFAFYYNSVQLTDPVVPPGGGGTGTGTGGDGDGGIGTSGGFGGRGLLFTLAEVFNLFPEDKAQSDWQRENEALFTGFNPFSMFFEGYDHYDVNGNPVYHFIFSNRLDSELRVEVGYEDVLKLQERMLEEDSESGAE